MSVKGKTYSHEMKNDEEESQYGAKQVPNELRNDLNQLRHGLDVEQKTEAQCHVLMFERDFMSLKMPSTSRRPTRCSSNLDEKFVSNSLDYPIMDISTCLTY